MALFSRRKKKEEILPKEVREYYSSERRERTGIAWLLAIGTLVFTFIIAAGLFFGGRWIYRTAFNHDHTDTKQTADQNEGLRIDEKGNVVGGNSQAGSSDSSTSQSGSTGTSSTSTNVPSPSGSNSSASSATKPTTTPSTGPTPAQLIDTGPGDEL